MLMTYGDKWKHLRDLQVVEDKFNFLNCILWSFKEFTL